MTTGDRALATLGQVLKDRGYRFTTVTPATHQRIMARPVTAPVRLTDIFGWSRPFCRTDLPANLLDLLLAAGEVDASGAILRSRVRFSTLGDQLFVHSAFPTEQSDAVFFGPDTYRFARMVRHALRSLHPRSFCRIADIAAGSGAGGLYAAALLAGKSPTVVLADINRRALRFSRINALLNGVRGAEAVESDLFKHVEGRFDLIIANPPYLVDPLTRLYRHGGGALGADLSLKIVAQAMDRLAPGGRLVLYTGSCIVDGGDTLHACLRALLAARDIGFSYEEIDPDVFGEELERPPYDRADRIAAVGITIDAR